MLVSAGGRAVAPCTHERPVPIVGSGALVPFQQAACPLARSPDRQERQRSRSRTKGFRRTLAVARDIAPPRQHRRVLATPKVSKGQVCLTLCAPGVVEETDRREGATKSAYRAAKRYDWGDAVEL